jgi:hypothetical protein
MRIIGAGGVNEALSFSASECALTTDALGVKALCRVKVGRTTVRRASFRPTRTANVHDVTASASRRTFAPPLTSAAVDVIVSAGGIDRRDDASTCAVSGTLRQRVSCH